MEVRQRVHSSNENKIDEQSINRKNEVVSLLNKEDDVDDGCMSDDSSSSADMSEPATSMCGRIIGFNLGDLFSFSKFTRLMFRPEDPSCLAVVRILFGVLMILDTIDERGFAEADSKWGDPNKCHFPLFNFLHPLPYEWMCILYLVMLLGATGIILGAYFRVSCLCFILPYWYLFLLDKSVWNNHSYLFGLLSTLLLFSNAHHCLSIDGLRGAVLHDSHVPLWNYAILRFQVFVLYFIAGLKKIDQDWLNGYSMTNLASHWLFDPFKLLMSQEQIDFWIVHFFGFLLDLTIAFWMYFDKTRPVAMVFLTFFHLMNSQLFSIGMFPFVCIATMPLFCYSSWPRKILISLRILGDPKPSAACIYDSYNSGYKGRKQSRVDEHVNKDTCTLKWYHKLTTTFLLIHVFLQAFLPYSHFITKGYNNWTNGLYGYSWDMMVHSWDTVHIVIKVVDKDTGHEHFMDPYAYTTSDRYTKHGDMMVQYAKCIERNIQREHPSITNMAISIDVWTSLNRRFKQRMFDPRVDLLTVDWSPFRPVKWIMPLLSDLNSWRNKMGVLEREVYSWSNFTDAEFVADFPGLKLDNYINKDLVNVSLTILEGEVVVEVDEQLRSTLKSGDSMKIPNGRFHSVHTVSQTPAYYMYAYTNSTLLFDTSQTSTVQRKRLGIIRAIENRWKRIKRASKLCSHAVLKILYTFPFLGRLGKP